MRRSRVRFSQAAPRAFPLVRGPFLYAVSEFGMEVSLFDYFMPPKCPRTELRILRA